MSMFPPGDCVREFDGSPVTGCKNAGAAWRIKLAALTACMKLKVIFTFDLLG